jgi:hypothetical protein
MLGGVVEVAITAGMQVCPALQALVASTYPFARFSFDGRATFPTIHTGTTDPAFVQTIRKPFIGGARTGFSAVPQWAAVRSFLRQEKGEAGFSRVKTLAPPQPLIASINAAD